MLVNHEKKSKFIVLLYRIAYKSQYWPFFLLPFAKAYQLIYRVLVDWVMCVDIPVKTKIGNGLIMYHCFGVVINQGSILGDNCILRHNVTIGNKVVDGVESKCPVIGNNVEFGSGCAVIGNVKVGNNVIIATNAVVTKDVPDNCVVAGVPAKIIRQW
jgi:putative colanic acid biosynthesis acetyltransferase WcaB